MRKYWWTVWIKVAVLAIVLLLAYNFVMNKVESIISPYLIEETQMESQPQEEEPAEDGNLVMDVLGKVEDVLGVKIDFENLIFDFANEYAKTVKEQSFEERNPILEPLN